MPGLIHANMAVILLSPLIKIIKKSFILDCKEGALRTLIIIIYTKRKLMPESFQRLPFIFFCRPFLTIFMREVTSSDEIQVDIEDSIDLGSSFFPRVTRWKEKMDCANILIKPRFGSLTLRDLSYQERFIIYLRCDFLVLRINCRPLACLS